MIRPMLRVAPALAAPISVSGSCKPSWGDKAAAAESWVTPSWISRSPFASRTLPITHWPGWRPLWRCKANGQTPRRPAERVVDASGRSCESLTELALLQWAADDEQAIERAAANWSPASAIVPQTTEVEGSSSPASPATHPSATCPRFWQCPSGWQRPTRAIRSRSCAAWCRDCAAGQSIRERNPRTALCRRVAWPRETFRRLASRSGRSMSCQR